MNEIIKEYLEERLNKIDCISHSLEGYYKHKDREQELLSIIYHSFSIDSNDYNIEYYESVVSEYLLNEHRIDIYSYTRGDIIEFNRQNKLDILGI
jgi:hypothetical protein